MKIAGMVTFYNPNRENIKNILKYIDGLDKLYIIDNSTNNNESLIPNNSKIEYIPNLDNKGIAYALNKAAKLAIHDNFDWILTMDQDSIMTLNTLEIMKKYVFEHNVINIGIISPYHVIETNVKKSDKEIEECVEVMTSGNLLNLKIFEKIGGFKEWLFIDSVDIEYCMNLNVNNYKVIRLNNALMAHELGNTKVIKILFKKFICSNHNYIRRYYMVRNMLYVTKMYRKYFPGYCRYLKRVQRGQIRYIIFFEKDKIRKLKMMFRGLCDFKNGIKGKLDL